MRLLKFAALGSLVVLLSACQSLFKPGLDDPLPTERLASEHPTNRSWTRSSSAPCWK